MRSTTSGGTYFQVGDDLSTSSLSLDDTSLTAGTTRYYRVVAFDNNANVSASSITVNATTQSASPGGLSWPVHSPGYISLLPGVGGYGMNTVAGSGRHLGTPATTVILVNSLATGNTGSAAVGLGTNVFQGTWEYAWRHAASPKVIIPIVSGWVVIQDDITNQSGTAPRPGYVSYYGQCAPNPGLFLRGCNVTLNGADNVAVWHLRSYMGDDATGLSAGARDSLSSGYGSGTTQSVVLINCDFAWSVDELVDFFRSHSQISWIGCAFIEPLHISTIIHPEDGPGVDHGFGPIIGGDTGQAQCSSVSTFRNLWAHTTGRNPLVSSQTFVHANNLHYNHGRPGSGTGNAVQIIATGASAANYANIIGNAFIRGPNNNATMVGVSVTGTYPVGSAGYSNSNAQFGWTAPANQNGFFTTSPTGYAAATLQSSAYPSTWGTGLTGVLQWAANPLSPTSAEWTAFVDLMEDTTGAQPRWRAAGIGRVGTVFNQIRDRLNGVSQTDQFVDTVTEAGGWFTVSNVTIDPLNPGTHWHAALPTGSDRDTPYTSGEFSNGQSRVGYTRLEAWAYEQHLYVLATQGTSVGAIYGGYTPTIYAAPAALGTGSGNSEANAAAATTVLARTDLPPGTVVGLLPGVYTRAGGAERYSPAWRCLSSGTSGSPIRIVAKYSAIDLVGKTAGQRWTTADLTTVFAHANRTEFRHTGTSSGNGQGSGGPSFGSIDINYVEWNGICADEQYNIPHRDTGASILWSTTGSAIKRCVLYGRPSYYTTDTSDNHPGVRLENAVNCTVSDNVIYGFRYSGGPGGTLNGSHNHCGIQRYESQGTIVEHNFTFGNHTGIYLKDQDTARDETVRFNFCADINCGIEILNANETTSDVDVVYQNIIVDAAEGLILQASGRNIQVYNNTLVVPATSAGSASCVVAHYADTGCFIRNNIFVGTNGSSFLDEQFRTLAVIPSNYNRFFRTGTQFTSRYQGSFTSLSAWQSGTGQDANSSVGDPLFVNQSSGDYHLQAGSPCLTMSQTGGPVGCYITGNEVIGPRYS